mgnify:CR=1 FL=1
MLLKFISNFSISGSNLLYFTPAESNIFFEALLESVSVYLSDKYTISFKGDKIQFFVKDNEIIGFLDVEKNSKIYYYEKAKVKEGEDKNV